MPAVTQTFYEILGIGEDATPEDVSAARRSMIKAVHPDRALDEADRQEREQLSRAVNDMCDTLLDPIRRYDYDVSLARARRWPDGEPQGADGVSAPRTRRPSTMRPPAGGPQPSPFEMDEDELQAWEAQHAHDEDPDPDAGHPLVERLPGLARLEGWLTWPIAILTAVMFGASVFLYNVAGSRLLDKVGLHFGRFGSLGAVILMTVVLVVICLGAVRMLRTVRLRSRGHDGEA